MVNLFVWILHENLKKEIGEGDVVDMKLSDPSKNQDLIQELADQKEIISVHRS